MTARLTPAPRPPWPVRATWKGGVGVSCYALGIRTWSPLAVPSDPPTRGPNRRIFSLIGDRPPLLEVLDKRFEEIVCAALISLMGCMIFVQVIMRYVFSNPLSWTDEIAVYCMVWSVYLGGALAVREGAHIRVLNGILAFGGRLSAALLIISDTLWFSVTALIAWQGALLVVSFWEQPYISPALGISQKWPYLIVPLGHLLIAARLCQIYYRWFVLGAPPPGIPQHKVDAGD